jgi:hypothetical protein
VQGIGDKDVTTTKQPDGLTLVLSAVSFLEASLQQSKCWGKTMAVNLSSREKFLLPAGRAERSRDTPRSCRIFQAAGSNSP